MPSITANPLFKTLNTLPFFVHFRSQLPKKNPNKPASYQNYDLYLQHQLFFIKLKRNDHFDACTKAMEKVTRFKMGMNIVMLTRGH